ncbi:hypothetical protein B6S09_14015 [Oceanimonas baumannii]|uniref:Hemolysin activation/secretion protein n=2 Tax=Oceanimonas baumannii TaxID=129578 RepID=A0A235CE89_9GAMM|nr:hypothetical protein B6S09_14015 [Oceanimonas baumannii]TDW56331.1 hemolysin activation/secretion protein [Oceanimonas baumannii]
MTLFPGRGGHSDPASASGVLSAVSVLGMLPVFVLPQVAFAQSAAAERTVIEQTVILQRFTPPQKRGVVDLSVEDQRDRISDEQAKDIHLLLQSVRVDGAYSVSPDVLQPLWQSRVGTEITLADLYDIARAIDDAYLAAGYFSMTVVPVQDIESGQIRFQVYEGYVQRVEITSPIPGIERRLAPYIDRIMAMQPIRVKEAERVLLLMSDLAGVDIEGTFVRPEMPGAGGLLKLNIGFSPRSGMMALDNLGNDAVGPLELSAQAEFNDLFGYFERTGLLGVTIPDNPEEMLFLQLSQGMPIGHDGLFAGYNFSYIEQQPGGPLDEQDIHIASVVATGSLNYPFVRTLSQSLSGNAELTFQHDDVDIMNTPVSRSHIRRAELSLDYERALEQGEFSLMGGFGFGHISDLDLGDLPDDYHYWRSSLSFLRPLSDSLSLQVRSVSQYSPIMLPASLQFSAGGFSYGRAFDSGTVSGDSGVAAAAEISYEATTGLPVLPVIFITPFIDYGAAWEHRPWGGTEHSELGSYGLTLGGAIAGKLLFEVSTGLPWYTPKETETPSAQVLFRVSAIF